MKSYSIIIIIVVKLLKRLSFVTFIVFFIWMSSSCDFLDTVIGDEPKVNIPEGSLTIANNERQALTALYYNLSEPVTIQWYVDDVPVVGETNSTFYFQKSPVSETTYLVKVVVTDSDNSVSFTVSITVQSQVHDNNIKLYVDNNLVDSGYNYTYDSVSFHTPEYVSFKIENLTDKEIKLDVSITGDSVWSITDSMLSGSPITTLRNISVPAYSVEYLKVCIYYTEYDFSGKRATININYQIPDTGYNSSVVFYSEATLSGPYLLVLDENEAELEAYSSLNFGQIYVDTGTEDTYHTAWKKIQLKNAGSDPLTLTGIDISQSSDFPGFELDTSSILGNVIPSGENFYFFVRFNPTRIGGTSAGLTINSDCQVEPEFLIYLIGQGKLIAPDIAVKKGDLVISQSDEITFDVPDYATSVWLNFTICNNGPAILNIASVGLDYYSPFSLGLSFLDAASWSIDPGEEVSLQVAFTKPAVLLLNSWYKATVTIVSNDPYKGSFSFAVKTIFETDIPIIF